MKLKKREEYQFVKYRWEFFRRNPEAVAALMASLKEKGISLDMSDQLGAELRDLQKKRKEDALRSGRNKVAEIVFPTDGVHTSQNTVRNVWKRVLSKAELMDRRIHDTRHTFASILLSAGVSPAYVKEQLGHSSIQMTVDIYRHLIPGSNREAVNLLDSPHLSAP